jgi:hypothetical protein
MPKSKTVHSGQLDTWGRRNRKLEDRACKECGAIFRPLRSGSKYCSRPCAWKNNGGRNRKPECWWTNQRGYIDGIIWIDAETRIRVKQHRFIMQGILGRPLLDSEDVHHKDGNKANNAIENLEVIDHGKHSTLSNNSRTHAKGYKMNLTDNEREARSLRAISMKLDEMGRAALAIAKATGE